MTSQKIRAQSLRVGDKLRAKDLTGTVISADKTFSFKGQLRQVMHVTVKQANGHLATKDFSLGYCVTILSRETEPTK